MKLRLASMGVLVLFLGCNKGEPPLEARVTSFDSERYVIEVSTLSGLRVDVNGRATDADSAGKARIELRVAQLDYMKNATEVRVSASGRVGLGKYFGSKELRLPCSPEDAAILPKGEDWVKVLGGSSKAVSGGSLWLFKLRGKDAGGALLDADGSLELQLLTAPNVKVTFAGHEAVANELGRSSVQFTTEEVMQLLPAPMLSGEYASGSKVSVTVGRNGKKEDLAFEGEWRPGAQLIPFLERLRTGKRPGERKSPALVISLDSRKQLLHAGREGPVADVDVVAFGTAKPPRDVAPCEGYVSLRPGEKPAANAKGITLQRQAIDEEFVAIDVHSGAELGRKTFTAQDFCPVELPHGAAVLKTYLDRDELKRWLASL